MAGDKDFQSIDIMILFGAGFIDVANGFVQDVSMIFVLSKFSELVLQLITVWHYEGMSPGKMLKCVLGHNMIENIGKEYT